MAENSQIGWTESTWNPWHGCVKISPGCKNCYMYRDKERYGQDPHKIVRSKTTFNDPLKWKEPRMIFTCSWSDFFIKEADDWRADAWDVIRRTPQHTYQILTKRPERIANRLPSDWEFGYQNAWIGISAENQGTFDERILHLLRLPFVFHKWISFEPLLGPIDAGRVLGLIKNTHGSFAKFQPDIFWGVIGGESGPDFRLMEMPWLQSLVWDFQTAKVPVFVKQDSGLHPGRQGRIPNSLWLKEFPQTKESVL